MAQTDSGAPKSQDANESVAPEAVPESAATAASQTASSKRINVLYLNHAAQISGAEQSLRALLWELKRSREEIEPTIALPGSGPFAELLRDEGWNVTFAPLRRLQRPHSFLSGLSALAHILQTAPFVTKLIRQTRANIVHSNSTTAHLVGGLAAERLGLPAIWHARDMVDLSRISGQLSQRATAVIAISGCVAECLQRDGVAPEKIRIIHNGIDTDEWLPHPPGHARSTLRDTLGFGSDDFVFGCVGQLVPWKNQLEFIQAASHLCDSNGGARARFVILGSDLWGEHSSYLRSLRTRIKLLGLTKRFNFVPHQLNNIDAISSLDCVVLPSHDEPFGRVLLEGMALKKVVIAFAENGPREIITHEHDGLLVSPGETDGLGKAMLRAIGDSDLRSHLAINARETASTRFHIENTARHTADLYRQLMS